MGQIRVSSLPREVGLVILVVLGVAALVAGWQGCGKVERVYPTGGDDE